MKHANHNQESNYLNLSTLRARYMDGIIVHTLVLIRFEFVEWSYNPKSTNGDYFSNRQVCKPNLEACWRYGCHYAGDEVDEEEKFIAWIKNE